MLLRRSGGSFESQRSRVGRWGARYGNLMRAWRKGLDLDGSGKLSFTEFCKALRDQGFRGSRGRRPRHGAQGSGGHIFSSYSSRGFEGRSSEVPLVLNTLSTSEIILKL